MALNRISAVDFKDKLIAFIEKIMKEIYEKNQFTLLDLTIQSINCSQYKIFMCQVNTTNQLTLSCQKL